MLDKFIDLLPEQNRAEFKTMIGSTIIVNNREDAAKAIAENSFLKSERDAIISRTTASYAEKFQAERLPDLLKEEVRKLNPPKTPEQIENEELRNAVKKMQRDNIISQRKAQALQKLSELGLPADYADFAIDEDENIFNSRLDRLVGATKSLLDSKVREALTGAVGNQQTPKSGQSSSNIIARKDFESLTPGEQMKVMKSGVKVE